ncbi:MAG: hypothetical protein JXR16_15335 [Bermanella sp.]
MKFSRFLVLTALYNGVLGGLLLSNTVRDFLGVDIIYPGNQMIAGFLWFTMAVLLISSTDIKRYASIIYYESYLRFFAAAVLLVAFIVYDFGMILGLVAVGDIMIGFYYIISVKKETGYDHYQLLMNRIL